MRHIVFIFLLGFCCRSDAVPLAAYGGLPSIEDVALSPAGDRIAFVKATDKGRVVLLATLDPTKVLKAFNIGSEKLRELRWADEDHVLFFTTKTAAPMGLINDRDEYRMLVLYEISSDRMINLPRQEDGMRDSVEMMNTVAGEVMIRRIDGHTVLFIPGLVFPDEHSRLVLFRYDLQTKRQWIVGGDRDRDTRAWLVDQRGELLAQQLYAESSKTWKLRVRHDGKWRDALSINAPIDTPDVLGMGPKDDSLLIATYQDKRWVWKSLGLADTQLADAAHEYDGLRIPIEDFHSHHLIGGVSEDDETKYVFFDPALQSRWNAITNAYSGELVRLISASEDFHKLIVRVEGIRDGLSYKIIDMQTVHISPLGDVYDGIDRSMPVRAISYAAADGLKIPAILTLPAGKTAHALPLVVFPHGGPAAHDTIDFDWWAQAMASQGYAVLQPNFRGSTLSEEFMTAGFGEWGRKMQTDLSDGVRYLAKEGSIDPQRVCIVGASYGGYAALAGASLDASVYRCAVSVAGISDLKRMLVWERTRSLGQNMGLRYWDRFMGVTGPDDPALEAISPIRHIDRIKAPILLIHGKDDTVVAYEQSERMLDELQKAHKPVNLITLKKEDHWLSRSETRLAMLQATVDFLHANNPPD